MRTIIVTRHPGTIEWLKRRGITGEVIAHATPDQVEGAVVYGVLPMHLAALAAEYWAVEHASFAMDRGRELSADELDARAARMVRYSVTCHEVRA